MHWFRSKLRDENITIEKVDTQNQRADIFTKGLRIIKFVFNRTLLCGWKHDNETKVSAIERECWYGEPLG
jgi:hypothetical protein